MAKNGTVAKVTKLPDCDFCKIYSRLNRRPNEEVTVKLAQYDFRTKDGRWANGCEGHYLAFRLHRDLGIGKGQKLEVVG